MTEAEIIKIAKKNTDCWKILREKHPEVADWMCNRTDDLEIMNYHGNFEKFNYFGIVPNNIIRLRKDYKQQRYYWLHLYTLKIMETPYAVNKNSNIVPITEEYYNYLYKKPKHTIDYELGYPKRGQLYVALTERDSGCDPERVVGKDKGPHDRGVRWIEKKPKQNPELLKCATESLQQAQIFIERAITQLNDYDGCGLTKSAITNAVYKFILSHVDTILNS